MGQTEGDGGFHAPEAGLECAPGADVPVEQPLIAWKIIRDGAGDELEVWLEGRSGARVYAIGRDESGYEAYSVTDAFSDGDYDEKVSLGKPTPSLLVALAQCEVYERERAGLPGVGPRTSTLGELAAYWEGHAAGHRAGYGMGYATRGIEALSEDEAQRREVG